MKYDVHDINELKEMQLLFPFVAHTLDTAYKDTHGNLYKVIGPSACYSTRLIAGFAGVCGMYNDALARMPIYHASLFARRTDKLIDEIVSLPKERRCVIIDMANNSNELIGSVVESLREVMVFLRYQVSGSYPAPEIRMRPLTIEELREYVEYRCNFVHGGVDKRKRRWNVDKTLIQALHDSTRGYQSLIREVMDRMERAATQQSALEHADKLQNKNDAAGNLYGVMVDSDQPLEAVVRQIEKAIGSCAWELLGGAIQDRLTTDMLAGGSDFVMRGEHQLLTLDMESTRAKFVAGCLEIARVLRQRPQE